MALEATKLNSSVISEKDLLNHRMNMEKLSIINGLLNITTLSPNTVTELEGVIINIIKTWK